MWALPALWLLNASRDRCRLCGGDARLVARYDIDAFQPSWRAWGADPSIDVLMCEQHGSLMVRRPPPPEVLVKQYRVSSQTDYYAQARFAPTRRNQRLLGLLARHAPAGAQVVDVGGGDGSFAVAARRAGFAATLNEVAVLDHEAVEAADVPVVADLSQVPAGSFDVATLWDVYEHVWPHDAFMAPIRDALRPGGRVLIEIPSPSRLIWPLWAYGLASASPRRETAFAHVVSFTHLQLMTPNEIAATLPMHGFVAEHMETASELAYQGVAYAERLLPGRALAEAVGSLFDKPAVRRTVLGDNKTFIVARRV